MFDDFIPPLMVPPEGLATDGPVEFSWRPTQAQTGPTRHLVAELWNLGVPFIVVAAPTGVVISNQTGGCACHHPELEGYLLPVPFVGSTGGACCDPDIDEIGRQLAPLGWIVDVNAPEGIEEAWIPVVGRHGERGFLTYQNCD